MNERKVSCKSPGCSNLILEATAERTGGYCMPCVQAASRTEREEFVLKNRRDVNEFAGITDAVEVLKIFHRPRRYDPLINWIPYPTPIDSVYLSLSDTEKRRLSEYAEKSIGTERNEEAESICLCLSAFTDARLDGCTRQFVSHSRFWPSLIFRGAPSDVRDELLARVNRDKDNRNHILLALAWIGDSTVVEHFDGWRRNPPTWRDSLNIAPEDYSREAGWELAANGERRDLFFARCFALESGPSRSPPSFRAIVERNDQCPWCKSRLTNLIEVEVASVGLAENIHVNCPVKVATCEVCTSFGTVFGHIDVYGIAKWAEINTRPGYLPNDTQSWGRLPNDCLRISECRSAIHAADQFLPTRFSQLGGHPTWIQHSAFPKCPECSETMLFLAQVDRHDIEEHLEGMYYAFVCLGCKMTATAYQQT